MQLKHKPKMGKLRHAGIAVCMQPTSSIYAACRHMLLTYSEPGTKSHTLQTFARWYGVWIFRMLYNGNVG